MRARLSALAAGLVCLAVAGGSARAQPSAVGTPSPPAPVTVQFPVFAATATTATLSFHPNRIELVGLSPSAAAQLLDLESAGRLTPTVEVKLGSSSTFTLADVIVTSVRSSAGGGTLSASAVLEYRSIRST
jgi:hypothetical protein